MVRIPFHYRTGHKKQRKMNLKATRIINSKTQMFIYKFNLTLESDMNKNEQYGKSAQVKQCYM